MSPERPNPSELTPGIGGDPLWKPAIGKEQRSGIDWLKIEALFIGSLVAVPSLCALAGLFG